MKKMHKISTALGTAGLSLAFAVSMASADTSLVNSGNNANVDSSVTHNVTVTSNSSNMTTVNQSSVGISNTGGNSSSGNIGGGSIATGAARSTSEMNVAANQNQTAIELPSMGTAGTSSVVNTGRNLDLDASRNYTSTVNSNSVNVLNSSQTSMNVANTGLNSSSGNIGGGAVATGTARTESSMGVEAGINQSTLDLGGMYGVGGGDLDLTNTGNNADIDNSLNLNSTLNVNSFNFLNASQFSLGLANSGLNFSNGNVNGGAIATGAATSGAEFDLMANQNNTGLSYGSSAGSAGDVEAINTGNGLDLDNSTTVTTGVTVNSTNAGATAETSVQVSNSGVNSSNGNVGGGALGSGSANVWSGFMSGGNWNKVQF